MAERRKSRAARAVEAREEARLRAAEFQKKEKQLQDLAAEHIVLLGDADDIAENAAKAIIRIEQQMARDLAPIQEQADAIVVRVAKLCGPTQAASRLGITAADVRAAVKAAKAAAAGDDTIPDNQGTPPATEAGGQPSDSTPDPAATVPEQPAAPGEEATHGPGALTA